MKLTPLLISILVFLMSGVMCLFSTQDVHAQVPQTKRSEQDSFLKNIRAKIRNNDLQTCITLTDVAFYDPLLNNKYKPYLVRWY